MHNFPDPIVQNVANFYVHAIGTGEPAEAIERYVGDRYIQHNLNVADGKVGFIQNFDSFTERIPKRDIHVIRGFRDEEFVFIHVLQDLDNAGLWVTMDFFKTENGKIVEHWDNIEKAADHRIAQQMIGGVTEVSDLDQTAVNKAIVRRFVEDGLLLKDRAALEKDVETSHFRHHKGESGGNWADFNSAIASPGAPLVYSTLHHIMGRGNFVATQVEGEAKGNPTAFYDLYRLENGKIVEHWGLAEAVPPRDKWKHQNGKF